MVLHYYLYLASSLLATAITCHAQVLLEPEYDYIVVGSGPGGGPLA